MNPEREDEIESEFTKGIECEIYISPLIVQELDLPFYLFD